MTLRACDVMQSPVVTVGPLDPLPSVRRLFADESIHGAPVVDETGYVCGVITSTDLMRSDGVVRDPATESGWERVGDSVDGRAEDVMTASIVRVAPDAPVTEVARKLREEQVHRVMVVDDEDVVGIISTFDLLQLVENPNASRV